MTLVERLNAVFTDIGNKLKNLRVVPTAASSGQVLTSTGTNTYEFQAPQNPGDDAAIQYSILLGG